MVIALIIMSILYIPIVAYSANDITYIKEDVKRIEGRIDTLSNKMDENYKDIMGEIKALRMCLDQYALNNNSEHLRYSKEIGVLEGRMIAYGMSAGGIGTALVLTGSYMIKKRNGKSNGK